MKQHKTPCSECPFRRVSAPGWLGADTPEGFLASARSDIRMPCHLHLDYDNDVDWEDKVNDVPQCAGRAIFLKNSCSMPRDPSLREFVNSVERDTNVFNWPQEFLDHHNIFKKKS